MLEIYTTCPPSKNADRSTYLSTVADVARWSDEAGCVGILVYTDNGLVDPWLVSQVIVENTRMLNPLVAVQPIYMHPYTAAKMVASFAFLHGRSVHLNMVAGGFRNDLLALCDDTPHDERYERLVEYTQIVMSLLRGEGLTTVAGRYFAVSGVRLRPAVPEHLLPEVLVSGSSPAGQEAARLLGATAVKYPQPPGDEAAWISASAPDAFGIRIGIIAREDPDEAWRIAHARFPSDRKGQITHQLATAISDSHWHRQLAGEPATASALDDPDPYWLGPFHNYKTFCPYLVGSYDRVARTVAHYIRLGAKTFILDVPASDEELVHSNIVFAHAQEMVAA